MRELPFQQIASKWLKTEVMARNTALVEYLPETKWWNEHTLWRMLCKYGLVYFKPDKGGGGNGIIRIENINTDRSDNPDRYEVHYQTVRQQMSDKQAVVSFLQHRVHPHKRYLLQQGIRLAQVADRPFDIRVIVQKPGLKWQVVGMVAKIAAKEKIVTNHTSGGMAAKVPAVLETGLHYSHDDTKQMMARLRRISEITAETLGKRYTGLRSLGLDIGLDEKARLWIFEVNTNPRFHLFRLTDPERYRAMLRNHRKIVVEEMRRTKKQPDL